MPAFSNATGIAFQGPIPMRSGFTPTTLAVTYLPIIFWPSRSAVERFIRSTAAAPSETCEELPAWIVPSLANAGLILDKDVGVIPGRTPSSRFTVMEIGRGHV